MSELKKAYIFSQEKINELVKMCTQAGIEAYQKREQQQQEKRAKESANDKARRMREKLSCYRRVKKTLKEEQEYTAAEKYEYRLKFLEDLMGVSPRNSNRTERFLLDQEEKRKQDYYSIRQIDSALELYRQECEESKSDEQKRRLRIIRALYIDDEAVTVTEIAERESVSVNTIYRDINIACEIMYQYVIGM